MLTVHKYELDVRKGVVELSDLPLDAKVVHVDCQDPRDPGVIQLWAEVWTESAGFTPMGERPRTFQIIGTGHMLSENENAPRKEHIGTVVTAGGELVWHVYEVKP